MIVIKVGRCYTGAAWYQGHGVYCEECGCAVTLEATDIPRRTTREPVVGTMRDIAYFSCPECHADTKVTSGPRGDR